jgi:hypothetical protein
MPETNVTRLRTAGILDPTKELTQDQIDAIESLTGQEVSALISSQAKLYPEITDEDELIAYPGIPEGY